MKGNCALIHKGATSATVLFLTVGLVGAAEGMPPRRVEPSMPTPSLPSPSVTSTATPAKTQFEQLRSDFENALTLSEEGKHDLAILAALNAQAHCSYIGDCFDRSHFYLGRIYANKGDSLNAINAFDRYTSQIPIPAGESRRGTWSFAKSEVDRLTSVVRKQGATRLLIESKQAYAMFQLDGSLVRIVPGTTLHRWVEPGKRILSWGEPSPGQRSLQVSADMASMHVVLGEPEPPPPVALVAPVVPPTLPGKRVPRWGLVGVGIPLMAIGGFFIVGGGVGYSVNGQCVGDPCTARYDGTVAAPAYLGTGIGSFLLGSILTAVGGYGRVPSAQPPAPPVESASRTFGLSQ